MKSRVRAVNTSHALSLLLRTILCLRILGTFLIFTGCLSMTTVANSQNSLHLWTTRARHSNVTQFFNFVSVQNDERQWGVNTTDDDFPITGWRSLFPRLKASEEWSHAGNDKNAAYEYISSRLFRVNVMTSFGRVKLADWVGNLLFENGREIDYGYPR